jgi:undecaprenyl-diphosphatase
LGFDLNGALFEALNQLAGHVAVVDDAMVAAARFAVFAVFAVVCASWFLRTGEPERRRVAIYTAGLSAILAIAVAMLIQQFYVHQRPFVLRSDTVLLMRHAADPSFPSEHATVAFAMASGLGLYRRRLGAVALALASLVAIARVFVGVHYPTDVAGGAAVGIISALAVRLGRPGLNWFDRVAVVRLVPPMLR